MAIPEQVRRQSEAVAKLYEDLNPESEAAQEAAETVMRALRLSLPTVSYLLQLGRRPPSKDDPTTLTKN